MCLNMTSVTQAQQKASGREIKEGKFEVLTVDPESPSVPVSRYVMLSTETGGGNVSLLRGLANSCLGLSLQSIC